MLNSGAPPKIFRNAQELRRAETPAEKILWEYLKDRKFLNLKFRRQHPFGNFIFDFYCHELKVAIELDGAIHDRDDQKERDTWRTQVVSDSNVLVVRFENQLVLEDIQKMLTQMASIVTPLLQERGGRRPG